MPISLLQGREYNLLQEKIPYDLSHKLITTYSKTD